MQVGRQRFQGPKYHSANSRTWRPSGDRSFTAALCRLAFRSHIEFLLFVRGSPAEVRRNQLICPSGHAHVEVLRRFSANDRAQTERATEGMIKLIAHRRGHVLGASILGAHAGELAHLWVIAIEQKLKLRDVAEMIAPYPTWGELGKAAASEFSRPLLTHPMTRRLVKALSWFP